MKSRIFAFAVLASAFGSSLACSSPSSDETTGGAESALQACPLGLEATCPAPISVIGFWERKGAGLTESLQLRADGTYSLTETSLPICLGRVCTDHVVVLQTEGSYEQTGVRVQLRPIAPVSQLPELFDVVRSPLPVDPVPLRASPDLVVAPALALHAVEAKADVYLTRAAVICPHGPLGPCIPPP